MTQTPCWDVEEVTLILKPDAEEIADHVFHSIHCHSDLFSADTADGKRVLNSPKEFVNRFLDPKYPYQQVIVLGESGTGKSHLIQWLRLQIPNELNTVLLTIPKSGTSLKSILERIIYSLPELEQESYIEKIKLSGTQTTTQEAKITKFMNELAWAIQFGSHAKVHSDLAKLLPNILLDPDLRKDFFFKSDHTVNSIVQHVFLDPKDRDQGLERREFRPGDLPLEDSRYFQNSSKEAREAISFLNLDYELEEKAISLMNLNLDSAIANTLNFSADNLIELMSSVRKYLFKSGKRLILLIEDFARLQGIDNALLQALTTREGQGDEQLCELRWAMAVTTGYYNRIDETYRSRSTLIVDMDLSQPTNLTELTAGYLNALRHGDNILKEKDQLKPISSYCSSCKLKKDCFNSFGNFKEIGLFPFTENAIEIMARRSSSIYEVNEEKRFNPRKYLRSVLESVLFHHYDDLQNGGFPPKRLLDRIGGENIMHDLEVQTLQSIDTKDHERRLTLLELWDAQGSFKDLDKGIHDSFNLPCIETTKEQKPKKVLPPKPKPEPIKAINPHIENLKNWSRNNAILPNATTNELRELVYGSLEGYIDWDKLGYAKSLVASRKLGDFRRVSINFINQATQLSKAPVVLQITNTTNEAIAIEALLLHKQHRGWQFSNAYRYLSTLLEVLRDWSETVIQQLNHLYQGNTTWDPVIAIIELMTLCELQGGRIKISDSYLEQLTQNIWNPEPPQLQSSIHDKYDKTFQKFINNWGKYNDLLNSLISGTKGGTVGKYKRILPVKNTLSKFLPHLSLNQIPTEDYKNHDLKKLAELYLNFKDNYVDNLMSEKQAYQELKNKIDQSFGEKTTITDVVVNLKELSDNVFDQGLNIGNQLSQFQEFLDSLNIQILEKIMINLNQLPSENEIKSAIRIASSAENIENFDQLINHTDIFLNAVNKSFTVMKNELEQQVGPGFVQSKEKISLLLRNLSKTLDKIQILTNNKDEYS